MEAVQYWKLLTVMLLAATGTQHASAQLFVGFYSQTCPQAETLIKQTVDSAIKADPTLAASLLRFVFHDCFVQGCDASILLDTTSAFGQAEKDAPPNTSLRGFEVFDAAKAAVEKVCPKIVSCADIITLAAREATIAAGGPSWMVPTGRRDGNISLLIDAGINIPSSTFTYQFLLQSFLLHGLSEDEMITLSGAHTIGRAHCSSFSSRLYPNLDPTLNPSYASQLLSLCPQNANANTMVPLDSTPLVFDNDYYTNLALGKVLMPSDAALSTSLFGNSMSSLNSQNSQLWGSKFVSAIEHMSQLNMKLGTQGEIRTNCRVRG